MNTTNVKVSNKYDIKEKSEVVVTDNLTEGLYASGCITAEESGTKTILKTGDGSISVDFDNGEPFHIDYADITTLYLALKVLHERQGYRTKIITEEDFNV
jgi:hypothetical protein